jgi:hypothetical protein
MNGDDRVELKDYIERLSSEADKRYEQRFNDQDKAVAAALAGQEKAVAAALAAQEKFAAASLNAAQTAIDKAERNTKDWQNASNEWRGAMSDRERMFLTRNEYALGHADLARRIGDLEKSRDTGTGKTIGLNAFWGYLVGAAGLVAILLRLLVR